MMAGRLAVEANAAFHAATFWIIRAVIDPSDAGKRDCRRAHGAGLERHIEIGTWQSLGFILAAMVVATMASLTKMWVDKRSDRNRDEQDSRQENTVGEPDAGGERSH